MAVDFTTFTEVDPDSKITKTADKITWSNLKSRGDPAYVYKDMGENFFDGDFEHRFQFYFSRLDSYGYMDLWRISDVISADQSKNSLYCQIYQDTLHGYKEFRVGYNFDAGSGKDGYNPISYSTLYYVVVKRDEAVGTYGTIYAYLSTGGYYDDGGSLIATLSKALPAKLDFQYIYGMANMGWEDPPGYYSTGYFQYLDLQGPHTITASAGSGGSISPSGDVSVDDGDDQEFIITPNDGYAINDVQVDSVSVGRLPSYTFTNVTDDHTIEASFEALSPRATVDVEDGITLEYIRQMEVMGDGRAFIDENGNFVYKSRFARSG
jgi:hypothetical protein